MEPDEIRKAEIMQFLHERVFDAILGSPDASERLKKGVRTTIMRMTKLSAVSMISYYWSAAVGTDRSIRFAEDMRKEGLASSSTA